MFRISSGNNGTVTLTGSADKPKTFRNSASASVITYVMPVVALILGVSFLNENMTVGALMGLVLIGAGSWLATRR